MDAIIDPTMLLRNEATAGSDATRPGSLSGLRIGLFENTKRNAAALLDAIGEQLAERDEDITLVRRTKGQFGMPMSSELMADLRSSCDVVVVGVGDCGSCSASAISDGIALEAHGIPSAVVVTEVFEANARAIAALEGAEEYPFLMIPHPFATLSTEQLEEQARELVPRILGRLTDMSLAASPA